MRGEEPASLRALDRARTLWAAQPGEEPDGLLLGSATVGDPAQLAAGNNVELAYTPTNSSWLNRIEAQFTALRYFAWTAPTTPATRSRAA